MNMVRSLVQIYIRQYRYIIDFVFYATHRHIVIHMFQSIGISFISGTHKSRFPYPRMMYGLQSAIYSIGLGGAKQCSGGNKCTKNQFEGGSHDKMKKTSRMHQRANENSLRFNNQLGGLRNNIAIMPGRS